MFIKNTIPPTAKKVEIQRPTINNTTSEFKLWAKAGIKPTLFNWKDFEKITRNSKWEIQLSFSHRQDSRVTCNSIPLTPPKKPSCQSITFPPFPSLFSPSSVIQWRTWHSARKTQNLLLLSVQLFKSGFYPTANISLHLLSFVALCFQSFLNPIRTQQKYNTQQRSSKYLIHPQPYNI